MNRTFVTLFLVVAVVALGAAAVWLMIGQQELQTQLTLKETEVADGQATLVQVFAQQRESGNQLEEGLATVQAELEALRAEATAVAPAIATQAAASNLPTSTPLPTLEGDADAPPQVRIRLAVQEPIRLVGEPIEIIASASHPIGIASLNILVNDETLFVGQPFDPRMEISVLEWVPETAGTYQISAIATTIRGKASNPVVLEIEVIESAAQILDTQLRIIEENVRELRNLEQMGEISVNVIDRLDLQENITVDLFNDFTREDADRDVLVLSSFDFMERGYALYDALVELYGFVVAGYYDEATDSLYVVNEGSELERESQLTHAHEYMHALQDQYFTLANIQNGSLDSDATLALRALAEGEASLVEFVYETSGYLTGEQNADSDPVFNVPESIPAPNMLVSQLSFPYVRGLEFLSEFYAEDGFEGVNAIWQNPPISTEQILHPDRYLAGDDPIPVTLPDEEIMDALGEGWQQLADDVFGEFYLIEYLGFVLDEDVVRPATTGWGGDRYAVFYNPSTDERVMVMKTVWDEPADLTEFVEAYQQFGSTLLGEPFLSDGAVTCWNNRGEEQCLIVTAESALVTRSDTAELRQLINSIMLSQP